MRKLFFFAGLFAALLGSEAIAQNADGPTNLPAWISRPLTLTDCLNIALAQNATILKAKNDLEAADGLVIEPRAVALPQLTASGQYKYTERSAIESFPVATNDGGGFEQPNQNWNAGVQLVQSIYEGGRIIAAFHAADATRQQALAQFQTVVADTLLNTRIAYYDVLLAAQQITVHEASVNLLQKEFTDQQNRFKAGTVPKFNLLRADVAVANERPNL